ncbi:MAG: LysR family transcriptional regulator, partial [Verrucomicrobia bacterium]|nr:LysR family transcriptional regulator [Verrucomicrobiota bacterium]
MLAQLRAFLIALEEGSLNRAALRLRISQSTLSRQMQVLENEIGGALLERTTAGIRPTDAGYALATSLPRVLADYDAAIEEARRLARGQRDLIRLGYLGSAAQMFLDPALSALRRAHPEVKVKLLDLSPGEQIVALRKGEIDLALIGQEGALLSSEFYIRKLTTLGVVAVMPADHPLASRKRISLQELHGERFISSPEEDLPGRDRWIIQLCRRAGFRPNFVQKAGSVSNMFTLIGSEGAVTLVPAYLKSFPVA